MRIKPERFLYGGYLRRISAHLVKLQDDLLAPYNITSQQARVMGMIQARRLRNNSCVQKDLENAVGLRGSSVTSLLQGLEKRGFIQRVSGEDARTKQLMLTEKGEELADAFLSVFHQTERKMVAGMSPGERSLLLELLERVSDNLDSDNITSKSNEITKG